MAASPWQVTLGTKHGRIAPAGWTAPHGRWVFCLGLDEEEAHEFALAPDDFALVSQAISIPSSVNLVRAAFRFRVDEALPAEINATGDAEKYVATTPGVNILRVPKGTFITYNGTTPTGYFGTGRICVVSGSGLGNDGRYRIDAVLPAGVTESTERAILHTNFAAVEAGLIVQCPELQWRMNLEIDDVAVATMLLDTIRSRDRVDMAANVSKITGNHKIGFRVKLDEAA